MAHSLSDAVRGPDQLADIITVKFRDILYRVSLETLQCWVGGRGFDRGRRLSRQVEFSDHGIAMEDQ